MKTARVKFWLGASGLSLIGVFLWLSTPRSIPPELPDMPAALIANPTPTAEVVVSPPAALVSPPLPPVEYPLGSVGYECEVNEFPPAVGYWFLEPEERRLRGRKNLF
ncbi:MAG: hypothetical protein OXH84_00460 [Gammaproteobacteria bacterium]|nr:hypothetical protein [Gammaproteobacteria bacterium]